MNPYIFTTVLLVVTAQTCKKQHVAGLPVCIQQRIEAIKKEPKWNPPAEVHEYIYNDKRVFYFSSNCCDQYNVVYDENCHYICAPSGGLSGKGDGKCGDFNGIAQYQKLVWKDER
jgi:hypothetical protein